MVKNVWTTVGISTVELNDQGCFDASTNLFTTPVDGCYSLGGTLRYKKHLANALLGARLLLNGLDAIPGPDVRIGGTHYTGSSAINTVTLATLSAGDTVALQCRIKSNDAYVEADTSEFWGHKLG
jgi:hypothetical protein